MAKKTDNHNPKVKLDLRRYFLAKYHTDDPAKVFDCCQGSGVLWSTLRKEFEVASYWGVDLKPKPGRLKIDSQRVLAQRGWTQNVVDIDTYGSPFKHWRAMLPNVPHSITVFLTIGQWQMGTDKTILDAIGLGRLQIPPGIAVRLHDFALPYLLSGLPKGLEIVECLEAISDGSAKYLGLRVVKSIKTQA